MFTAISVVWQDVLFLWFWGTLYNELPSLRTNDGVWLFVMVDAKGGFRIVMLIYSCLCALILPFQMVEYLKLGATRFLAWTEGTQEDEHGNLGTHTYFPSSDDSDERRNPRLETLWSNPVRTLALRFMDLQALSILVKGRDMNDKFWNKIHGITSETPPSERESRLQKGDRIMRLGRCFFGFTILILTIAGVEKIIQYNDLAPTNDLSKPGQLIPLILGIITFLEGATNACMPSKKVKKPDLEIGQGSNRGSVVEFSRSGLAAIFPDHDGTIGSIKDE